MTKIVCEIDGSILTEKSLYAHNKIHLHEEYKCKFCMKVFKTEKDRNEHQNSVHSEEKLECNECDEKFTRKFALKRHIKDIHLKLKYYCKICGQHYPRKDTLKIHYKKCQNRARTDDKNVEDEMTKFFADNAGQYQNQFNEYSSKEICHQCSKAFTNKSALKTHISDVHSSTENRICKFCNHIFSSKN